MLKRPSGRAGRPKHAHGGRRRARRAGLLGAALLLLALGAVTAAWAADDPQPGVVTRNVTLAGREIGGLDASRLTPVVEELAAGIAGNPVTIATPRGGFAVPAEALGLALPVAETVEAALELRTAGPVPVRMGRWLRSFFRPIAAPVPVQVDGEAVRRVVEAGDPGPRREPIEPRVRWSEDGLEVVPGQPGAGIDPAEVIERLPEAAAQGLPITVEVGRGEVPTRFGESDARALIEAAESLTAEGLEVRAGLQQVRLAPDDLRRWITSEAAETSLVLRLDREAAVAHLREALTLADPQPVDARFDVVEGALQIVPGVPGRGCCDTAAGAQVESAVLDPGGDPGDGVLDLPLTDIPPEVTASDLARSGIREEVGAFTTSHAPGQPRVTNIHLMADKVRGQIIEPGATFSINEFVGRRTREKGFVADGVIEDGRFTEDVGGGVSQFATTLFNAAFFAGMDFPEYQSHSLYISRYPYGREATLSFPKPDLKVANPSPHPVLIWTAYTDTSITVSLYSTKWVEVEQTDQVRVRRGPCTLVRTQRTATPVAGGDPEIDQVIALYRPGEGVDCV